MLSYLFILFFFSLVVFLPIQLNSQYEWIFCNSTIKFLFKTLVVHWLVFLFYFVASKFHRTETITAYESETIRSNKKKKLNALKEKRKYSTKQTTVVHLSCDCQINVQTARKLLLIHCCPSKFKCRYFDLYIYRLTSWQVKMFWFVI